MPRPMRVFDVAEFHRRHMAGESMLALSNASGISRITICRAFRKAGMNWRNGSEANAVRFKNCSESERRRMARQCIKNFRGKKRSDAHVCAVALTRERKGLGVGPAEVDLAQRLKAQGFARIVCQKAVGRFNIDVALTEPKIGVEVFGGLWHSGGRHAARFQRRTAYLVSQGWSMVFIWVTRDYPLSEDAVCVVADIARSKARPPTTAIYGNGRAANMHCG